MTYLWNWMITLVLMASAMSVSAKDNLPVDTLHFVNDTIRQYCVKSKVDTNKDGVISVEEARACKRLTLVEYRNAVRSIRSYDDLQHFPNLEYLHVGKSQADTIDLRHCCQLKELDLRDCRVLKTIILPRGCKVAVYSPLHFNGEPVNVIYR